MKRKMSTEVTHHSKEPVWWHPDLGWQHEDDLKGRVDGYSSNAKFRRFSDALKSAMRLQKMVTGPVLLLRFYYKKGERYMDEFELTQSQESE